MKFTVPDDAELQNKDLLSKNLSKNSLAFQEEIKNILKLPKSLCSLKVIITLRTEVLDTRESVLQVLQKFTNFCREEVFPRHVKCMEVIQSRCNKSHHQLLCQNQDLARMLPQRTELQQNLASLEVKRIQAQEKQQQLNERLKDTLGKLQDCCENKTVGERKMAQDLMKIQKTVENLNVHLTETKSKKNYFVTQVKVQSESLRRCAKPFYLDKERTIFLRQNLTSMKQNLEDLVQRVKTLNKQSLELADANEPLNNLKSTN